MGDKKQDSAPYRGVPLGGMGVGISLSNLAGNVSKCGGIGCISAAQIGYRDKDYVIAPLETNLKVLGEEIQKANKRGV